MTNSLEDFKKANYEHLHAIWKTAQAGDLESLAKGDQLLVNIMMEHDEYHNQFEISDLLHDHELDIKSEVNPFLHIIFHQIIENQLESKKTIEAFQFYNAMKKNKISRHEAIHCIGAILSYLLYDVLEGGTVFDIEKYKLLLRRYKDKKPDKIMSLLKEISGLEITSIRCISEPRAGENVISLIMIILPSDIIQQIDNSKMIKSEGYYGKADAKESKKERRESQVFKSDNQGERI